MKINWKDVDKYENTYKLVENYNVYGFVFDCMDDMEQASNEHRYTITYIVDFLATNNEI